MVVGQIEQRMVVAGRRMELERRRTVEVERRRRIRTRLEQLVGRMVEVDKVAVVGRILLQLRMLVQNMLWRIHLRHPHMEMVVVVGDTLVERSIHMRLRRLRRRRRPAM